MKKILAVVISVFIFGCLKAGTVEKTYFFGNYTINNTGRFQVFNFRDTRLSGFPGEPLLPWQKVVLMLPAGEEAVSVEITREGEVAVPGKFFLQPAQQVLPLSRPDSGSFSFSEQAYGDAGAWPAGVMPESLLTSSGRSSSAWASSATGRNPISPWSTITRRRRLRNSASFI